MIWKIKRKKKKMKKRVSVLFICIIYLFVSIKQCDLQVKCQNAIFAFHSVCVSYCTARRKHVLFFTTMENLPKIQLSAIFRFFVAIFLLCPLEATCDHRPLKRQNHCH